MSNRRHKAAVSSVPATPSRRKETLSTPDDEDDIEIIDSVDFTPRTTSSAHPKASDFNSGSTTRTPTNLGAPDIGSHLGPGQAVSPTPTALRASNEEHEDPR